MAQQHYDGKKHKKNAARADLLEKLGKTLDMGEIKGIEHHFKHFMSVSNQYMKTVLAPQLDPIIFASHY